MEAASSEIGGLPLDPITLELIRNSFLSICEEMRGALVRSGHSTNIKERHDCSCSIYTGSGQMVVQAEHLPVHLGVMPYALKGILAYFPPRVMRPGDAFVTNDPYHGGNHLPDLILAGPLFLEGRLVGVAASMAHHSDVGGTAPRSMPADATEIFHEGLRVPPIQLSSKGEILNDVLRLITANSRTPAEFLADVNSQIAVLRLAQRRIDEIGHRYDASTLIEAMPQILDASEQGMRAILERLPNGQWVGESEADYGGAPLPIRVTVGKHNDELHVDFTGSAPQTRSPFNASLANTHAAVLMALRVMLGEEVPANEGLYRPVRIVAPKGSIVNPAYPAAVSAATEVSYYTFQALVRAFENLAPRLVVADSGAGGVFSFGGINPRTGDLYAYGEALGGGSGATPFADGENCAMPPLSNVRDTPVEALEHLLPVRVERFELIGGSGGLGRFRGGLGFRRVFRMLAPATWSFQAIMCRKPACGWHGGLPGRVTQCNVLSKDRSTITIVGFTRVEVQTGDLITIETAGGGGYGPPEERRVGLMQADLNDGYVLPEQLQFDRNEQVATSQTTVDQES